MTTTPTATPPMTAALPFGELQIRLTGQLVLPSDPEYPTLAQPWNVAVPSAPVAIVRAHTATDVAAALQFATRHDLLVDVRATGHGAVPTGAPTLLVHTGALDEVTVHPQGWARVGAGVRWQQVLDAAAPLGLAPLCGSAPHVGVVGYLTGGGVGPVAHTFGFASDTVRAFDVVTGDGELRRVTPTQHPDLFWGLRGGRGALGIVTAVEFDLLPVAEILGGARYFAGADAAAVMHAWARWSGDLPIEATTSLAVLRLPDLPTLPPPLAGRTTVAVRFAWVGDPDTGRAVLASLDVPVQPVLDGIGVMPYAAIGSIHADPVDPMPSHERADLLTALPGAAVDALLTVAGPDTTCPQVVVELRRLGGAMSRAPGQPSALGHRDAGYSLLAIGLAVPPLLDSTVANAGAILDAVGPWSMDALLPNFGGAATPDSVRRTYDPGTLNRPGALAEMYDPHGRLVCGRAVRLASGH